MDIAAYYFPNYHVDPRNESVHGKGWTEWELMKCARSRFPGHNQPRVPLWGYEDESDPEVMANKIDVASKHGIDVFVFDWYWYDGPFLSGALDRGFLKARNSNKLKFAIMWANHDWYNRHPIGLDAQNAPMLYKWSATKESIGFVWDYLLENYLLHPNYWSIDGLPYFSIYAANRFIQQMGGVDEAAEVLALFRRKAEAAGLPGLHINGIWFDNLENSPACICPQTEWVEKIGFSSYTSYNCCGLTPIWNKSFPSVSYAKAAAEYLEMAKKASKSLPAPYFPVVTTGWDSSPRTIQSEAYESVGYPYLPVMEPDPSAFEKLLRSEAELNPKAIFINAWNEWTEGAYLEPDTKNGMKLLQAIKHFREKRCTKMNKRGRTTTVRAVSH